MNSVQFNPRGLVYLAVSIGVLGVLLALDRGTGPVTRVWPFLVLAAWLIASIVLIGRMWRLRHKPNEFKRTRDQLGIYPLLPRKVQKWMLGED